MGMNSGQATWKPFGRWDWGRDSTLMKNRHPGFARTVALPHLAGMMKFAPLLGFRIPGINVILAFLILHLFLEEFPQI